MREDFSDREDVKLAMGLGLFSIGLGLAEFLAPRQMADLSGMPDAESSRSIVRALGAREVGHGVAILSQPDQARWLWSRVGGDAIDLAVIGAAAGGHTARPGRLALSAFAVAGVTALDVLAAQRLSRRGKRTAPRHAGMVRIERVVTVNRTIEAVYGFWKEFENFPRFMRHLEAVTRTGDKRSHWKAKAPAGTTVEWDAELVQDRENEWLAWESIPGSGIQHSGSVRFHPAPGARGTEVRVQLQYRPPAGALGRGIAWIFGEEPDQQIREDLQRFKQIMETGEVTLSDGPGLWRPARPAKSAEDVRTHAGVQR